MQSIITINNYDSSGNMKPDNATAVMIDLNEARPDDPRISTGIVFFKTNSTGHLDFLDNMIAIYQVKASSKGTDIRI